MHNANTARTTRGRTWAAALGGGGLVALVGVLMLAPAGLGVTPGLVTVHAPYRGAIAAAFGSTGQVSCGTYKVVSAPHLVAKTGTGGFSDDAKAPACKTPNGIANRGDATGQVSFVMPLKLRHHTVTVTANWSLAASATTSVTAGACAASTAATANCYQEAESYLYAESYVIDTTNGSFFFGTFLVLFSNFTENNTYCTAGSCSTSVLGGSGTSFAYSQTLNLVTNVTGVNSTHTYILEVDLFGGVLAELDASNTHVVGGITSATLNFATVGNGAVLNYLTYT